MRRPEVNRLFKYRKPTERNLNMLASNQVFFAAPVTFNDPFDCALESTIDDVKTSDELISLVVQRFAKYNGIPEQETRQNLNVLGGANDAQLQKILATVREHDVYERLNNLGVFSLSEIDSHPLLWAHYADGHKGFCIEYNRTPTNNFADAQPVTYSETYPRVSLFRMDVREQSDIAVFTKSIHWRYEKEWRRVIRQPNSLQTHDNSDVAGIIFGAKMDSAFKGKIVQALQGKPNINYYQARLKQRSYDLYIDAL